jgi:hypothetical protein
MQEPSFLKVWDIAFDFVRKLPSDLCDELHESLNRGVDVLDSEPLLQMYIYAFGKMHKAKLQYAFEHMHKNTVKYSEVEIVDYGCGQGLATICYHDYLQEHNIGQKVKRIILIEPSSMALSRAELLCARFFPEAEIIAINKQFDNLAKEDLNLSSEIPTIHLLSNILDVESYDLQHFSQIVKEQSVGDNEYVIVSPIQNANRMKRLKDFVTILNNNLCFEQYLDKHEFRSDKDWTCAVLICSTKNDKKEFKFDLDDLYETAVSIIEGEKQDEIKCIEVFHMLSIGAMSGDMRCQNALGCFYRKGIGTDQDFNKAFEWFNKSANLGFNKAIFNLSICYRLGEGTAVDYQKYVELLRQSCDSGFIPSYNYLAICYMNGQGVEKDTNKAIDLWEYASEQNEPKAQRNLGYRYLTGKDVPKDILKGLSLLKSASEKGDAIAFRRLGECYKEGKGVDVNIPKAIDFFTKAGLLEDKKSILKLIEIFEQKEYKNMFGDEQFDVFVKAVRLGIPEISKITISWSNKEPEGFNDGDVVYGSNGLRIVTTRGKEI